MVALANFNPIWFVRRVRLLFASLLLWFAAPHHAICKPGQLRIPPVGETTTVRVMRGESIEVTLKAFESQGNNPLAYDVVSYPQHGRLGDIRQADRNRQGFASVVYTHDDDENSTSDEFTFKARSLGGSGVSSPIKVKVQIIDAPPQLQITPVVDFAAVAGESDRQQIILANEGGGMIEGRIAPKEPFHVEGEGRFSLGRGQLTNIIIRFSPQSAESVAPQKISPAPADPGAKVTLRGQARAPFAASAEPLQVQPDGARAGKISITNFSVLPIKVDLTLAPESYAEAPAHVAIPGQAVAEIPISIASGKDGKESECDIAVANAFHRQNLKITVPAVPPRLELATRNLDFRGQNEAVLIVKNTGGTEGRVLLELPASVKAVEGAENFPVKPGKERSIPLRRVEKEGMHQAEALVVDLGRDGKESVALLLPAPAKKSETAGANEGIRTNTAPVVTPAPELPWRLNEDVRLQSSTDGGGVLTWITAKPPWTKAQLEVVDENGPRPYRPAQAPQSLWQTVVKRCQTFFRWCTGEAAETGKAVEENFKKRLIVPGEDLLESEAETSPSPAWSTSEISPQDTAKVGLFWHISAEHKHDGRQPVSERFVIEGGALSVARQDKITSDTTQGANLTTDTNPAHIAKQTLLPGTRTIAPALKIFDRREISGRKSSRISVIFARDPEAKNYRLERLERTWGVDPATGFGTYGEFAPAPHAGDVRITRTNELENEGQKLSLIEAEIDGLNEPVSVWRIVTMAGSEDRWPTGEFYVRTLPPWRFPWTRAALAGCALALAGVLTLNWRSKRATH